MRLALPSSLFWWYWNFQVGYHKTTRTIYFSRWKHLSVCHYFVIYVSPFAYALEPDHYQWKRDILEHSDVNCLYVKPWWTLILVVLHDANEFVLHCLPVSWWGGRCESGFVKWELAKILFADVFVQQAQFRFRKPWHQEMCRVVIYVFLEFSCWL